jgi:hypothetical protein
VTPPENKIYVWNYENGDLEGVINAKDTANTVACSTGLDGSVIIAVGYE